ncbi:hypothetical protein NW754_001687 [Fusarium falciforme]|nr:hypothetical protein NW754_001687 [Fusarium falciforme]
MQHTKTPFLDTFTQYHSFDRGATRANVGGAQALEHLSRALGEIDGLFAGMKYLDATEPLDATPPPSVEPDELALELDALCKAAASRQPRQPPQEIAWSSVRDVREGMQCLWRHFVKVSQGLNMPIINSLRETYKDSRGLRTAGVFAFRNTLTGPTPNDLEKVFAFCSLSYVVSSLLHARGRLKKTEILDGILIWLNALETPQEREAFRGLAYWLWPEAHDKMNFIDLLDYMELEGPHQPQPFQKSQFASPGFIPTNTSTEEKAQDHVQIIANATEGEWSSLMMMSHAFNIPDPGQSLYFGHCFDPGQSLDQSVNTSDSQNIDYSQSSDPNYNIFDDPMLGGTAVIPSNVTQQPATSSAPNNTSSCSDKPWGLRDTPVFTVVLKYCQENGSFWFGLSGWGAISKDIQLFVKWTEERAKEGERIYDQYLTQLVSEKDTKDVPSRGIVSVVEAFVEIGYLQSTSEVKDYMIRIAKSLFCDVVAYNEFVEWILPP